MPQGPEVEPLYVDVGKAIRAVRGPMSQDDLAEAIGKNQRTLSAYEDGRVRIPLHLIPEIETACGAKLGAIFHEAGLIHLDVEAAIRSDPALSEYGHESVAGFYRFTRDEYARGKAQA